MSRIGKCEKLLLSETTRRRCLVFVKCHHLVDLFQVCSNYSPWAKNDSAGGGGGGGSNFYIGFYRDNVKKTSCLKPHGLEH